MAVFVTALLVLLIVGGSTALLVGSMLLSETMWRRNASADLLRGLEALLRAHAA